MRFVPGLIAVAVCLSADSGGPAFEVASLKPSGPVDPLEARLYEMIANNTSPRGFLPGHANRVEIHGWSAAELVAAAFRTPMREIVGPSWIFEARYDIDALIPAGQARDKAPEMLLTLLQERLALEAHREARRTSGYTLSVGKGGPKLEETGPPVPTMDPSAPRRTRPGFNRHQQPRRY